jgi:hypothetical protein
LFTATADSRQCTRERDRKGNVVPARSHCKAGTGKSSTSCEENAGDADAKRVNGRRAILQRATGG